MKRVPGHWQPFSDENTKPPASWPPDTNHTILGIRRIGKTSLLREIERILKEREDEARVVYLECSDLLSTDDYIREVVRKLNPRELRGYTCRSMSSFSPISWSACARSTKPRSFSCWTRSTICDHATRRLELFRMLRASSNKGACQYIIAASAKPCAEQYMLDSPFYNFAQEIRLSEFTRQQARELIATL